MQGQDIAMADSVKGVVFLNKNRTVDTRTKWGRLCVSHTKSEKNGTEKS